jgi:chromosome segregation ATPase
MMKFGGFLARKTPLPDAPTLVAAAEAENPLELDEELFSARGTRLGAENESLRNLLIDASAKIDELDTIKNAVGKLVDPVGKALRTIEAEQAEKLALQTVLNDTRTAYGKLRNEHAELEKKATASDAECSTLRQELNVATGRLKTAETTKADLAIDVAARRAQIVELEARLAQETGERKALTEENRRLNERLQAAEKRIITLESDLNGARQRLLIADDEKRAHQTMLDRASSEAAQLSRKLAETEASLNAAQGRLRHVEANFAELSTERNRLAAALDEVNERHDHELTSQRMRFEALQARASAGEKLLGEAREHLLARAEEMGAKDRRLNELAVERDGLQARLAELEAERITRESALQELDQASTSLSERASALARAFAAKEEALAQAEGTIGALNERLGALEQSQANEQQIAERGIEELKAALRREQMERSMVEGALGTARKDFSRVMRELMALRRQQEAAEPAPRPIAANAA